MFRRNYKRSTTAGRKLLHMWVACVKSRSKKYMLGVLRSPLFKFNIILGNISFESARVVILNSVVSAPLTCSKVREQGVEFSDRPPHRKDRNVVADCGYSRRLSIRKSSSTGHI